MKKSSPPSPSSATPVRFDRRSAGFTLIEVLIALIVLVLGVLGAAAMTLNSLKDSKQSGLQTQATQLAYEISDLMRANPGLETSFTSALQASNPNCFTSGCTPAEMAKNDYYEWITKVTGPNGLPGGNAVVCRDATLLASTTLACDNSASAPLVVKLKWDEKNNNARGQASAGAITTRILAVPILPCVAAAASLC